MGVERTARAVSSAPEPKIVDLGDGRRYDLATASPSCRQCLGTGISRTILGEKKTSVICSCVTDAAKEAKSRAVYYDAATGTLAVPSSAGPVAK